MESVVENQRVSRERKAAGLPVWDRTINIKDILGRDPGNTSEEHCAVVANAIGARLRGMLPPAWLDWNNDDTEIIEIVDGMESLSATSYADDPSYSAREDLHNMLDSLYDWADRERVWLGP